MVLGSGATSGVRIVTRKSLFDKMKNENLRNLEEKLCFLRDHLFSQDNLTERQLHKLKHNFAHFKSEMKQRWIKSHKKEEKKKEKKEEAQKKEARNKHFR